MSLQDIEYSGEIIHQHLLPTHSQSKEIPMGSDQPVDINPTDGSSPQTILPLQLQHPKVLKIWKM